MPGNADIIKEFLVSLGWQIDQSGQRKFATSIAIQTEAVRELGEVIKETGKKVFEFTRKIAEGLESLYFASQRTRASVANIQALGFAAGQMGSTAAAARESLENLARFMRQNPGGEGLIRSLGVETRDVNGDLRDTSETLQDLGKKFAQLPFYRANAYAQAFGIDEKTLIAMREGLGQFGDEYRSMLKAAGLDAQGAAKSSHDFMNQVRLLGASFTILGQKVAASLTGRMGRDIQRFREGLVDNFGRISEVIVKVTRGVLKMADVISTMALRAMHAIGVVIDWFHGLSGSTKFAIEALGGLLIAWKLLNKGMLATPLGRVLALASALLLLWDDYQVWREGGKSLFDWKQWNTEIQTGIKDIKDLGEHLKNLAKTVLTIVQPVMDGVFKSFLKELGHGAALLDGLASGNWSKVRGALKGILADENFNGPTAKWLGIDPDSLNGTSKAPRGIRNNNPGNIEAGSFTARMGAIGSDGRFAIFDNIQKGLAALATLLRSYARRGINTIGSIISRFAPPGENNTGSYISSVAKRLGIGTNSVLNLADPTQLSKLMDSIIRVENGRNPYSMELLGAAAGGGTIAAAKPNVILHQTNTTTITGASDPQRTAKAVGAAQHTVNERLVRNLHSKIQ
jgi:TP901 family phage tail tape measure protein